MMAWADCIESNCNLRPGPGELNNLQLLLSKTCARCNTVFTGKSPKLVCGACQQNVCKACAPSCGSDHSNGLGLGTEDTVCTVCVDKAKADVLEKFPSWITPEGYVAVEVDFGEVTYCDAAWWEESGKLGAFPQQCKAFMLPIGTRNTQQCKALMLPIGTRNKCAKLRGGESERGVEYDSTCPM